ncbi:YjbH domain-containing protein [Aliidiomarina sedimenti]|uniref:YjbH domain-containing protein n=1 Tax=Aliidiomarina sedimenti TaxID=1933879 RepID=A0ABY0BZQ1_9GAMM|nr:YjbH domain-containing protein [Aliidiomarina sedimenti]RUO30022.1 YjbH domain-containing protein [Aliidiomarina sedimenti]
MSILSFLVASSVTVQLNDTYQLEFSEAVRLNQVLSQSMQLLGAQNERAQGATGAVNVYWPAARIANTSDSHAQEMKDSILSELVLLQSYWRSRGAETRAESAAKLAAQIERLEVATQPYGQIDLALSRQFIAHNPLLQAASYQLILPQRSDAILMLGAVSEPGYVSFAAGAPVSQYLHTAKQNGLLLQGHDNNQAVVVRGDAQHQVDWAYYNRDGFEAQPGDIVWTPLRGLPRRFSNLNDDIAALLKHFVAYNANAHDRNSFDNDRVARPGVSELLQPEAAVSERHWSRLDYRPSRTHDGGAGLLQTPTARMFDEGEISLTYSDMEEYYRYSATLQVLPWMEATGFYVRFPNRLYSDVPDFSGSTILTDKGFDVKFRLWQESYWLPEVSVGLRDFAGTGIFDAEYIVTNKRFGAFDFSLGVGFGRLGTRDNISNPLCELNDEYCRRPGGFSGGGGSFEYDKWFKGNAGLFGGVEWQSPWQPLRVKVEYNSNDYSEDRAGVPIEAQTPWNIGLNYRVTDWLDVQASYERGDTLMMNFTLSTNFNTMQQARVEPRKVEPGVVEVERVEDVDWGEVSRKLRRNYALANSRFALEGDNTLRVFSRPRRYRDYNENLDRAARILADEVPDSITTYDIVDTQFFEPSISTRIDAEAFKARIRYQDEQGPEEVNELFVRSDAEDYPENDEDWLYNPDFRFGTGYGAKPFFNQDFGSPETFHVYQLGITAFARRWLNPNLELFGELGFNIANNYDKFNYVSDRLDDLPPVRTDVRRYIQKDVWLDSAQATYYTQLTNSLYAMAYGGYIERMFGGVGLEMVYRPLDQPWAVGFDVNRVRQRNYTGGTGFLDYEVTTGFVSLYYQMPWLEDTTMQLDFGRFLAGDDGVNVTFMKRFESGVTAGAFAAFTDVSSEEYGEGSFTKGFFINIPFDLMSVRPTRQRVGMTWIPLARNGGRQLMRRARLYDSLDERSPFWNR